MAGESRSDRFDRAGFESRVPATSIRPRPTDSVAEERLPTEFVRRLATAMVDTAARLDKSQPGAGWAQVLSRDAAWYFAYILAFWYLTRSNRGAEYLPTVRKLTGGSSFFILFNFLDSRPELKTLLRDTWDASPSESRRIESSVLTAATQIGLPAIRSALQIGLYQDIVKGLREKLGEPGYASSLPTSAKDAAVASGTNAPAGALALSPPALSDKQTCIAVLMQAGHSPEDAERICQGPQAKPVGDLLEQSLTRSRSSGRPVLAMVSATWCGPCKRFKQAAQSSPAIAKELRRFIFADFDTDTSEAAAQVAEKLQVQSYPTFVALGPDGTELARIVGYRDPESFAGWLRGIGGSRVA